MSLNFDLRAIESILIPMDLEHEQVQIGEELVRAKNNHRAEG